MEVGHYVIENTNETTWSKYFVRRILKVYDTNLAKVAIVQYCVLSKQ